MGLYESDYESAAADLIEYYGQPISYDHEELSDPEVISAEVHPEQQVRRKNEYGWYWTKLQEVIFDRPSGFEVRSDGTVTIGSTDYNIDSIDDSKPGNRMALMLVRAEAGEIGRPDFRGR